MTAAPTRIDADWLHAPETQRVFDLLEQNGHGARVVGGAVRNALLGFPATDIDFATTATPDVVLAAAARAGARAIKSGLKHGTVTLVIDRQQFEVTTLRADVETDGRHAHVAFTEDWRGDAERRDFTINALYADRTGRVDDWVGGLADIAAHRVRFVGDPATRIREDYLRILRFFRFSARYGVGPIDREGRDAICCEQSGLAQLSAERIRSELLGILVAPRAVEMIGEMIGCGFLPAILGAAPHPATFADVAARDHALDTETKAIVRLTALAVSVSDDVASLKERLRLSNAETRLVAIAAPDALSPPITDPSNMRAGRALMYRLGVDRYRAAVILAAARAMGPFEPWQELMTLPERWPIPKLGIGGAEVMARTGLGSGTEVGSILHDLEAWWIAADFPAHDLVAAELERRLGTRP
jgi:poly(A) polymerase